MKRAWIIALLVSACAPRSQDRCLQVKAELDACIGATLPQMDCATLSDGDLDRVHDLTTGVSCELLAGALPLDGDYLSATCRLLDVGCVAALTPAPVHQPARLPIVLVNGIDTSPLFRYSDRILKTLRDDGGQQVFLATLPAYQPPRKRAPLLWARIQEIQALTGAPQVNLVCHSLGGLDCRHLVSPNGLPADLGDDAPTRAVASITTVGTAHRGTPVADALLGLLPGGDQAQTVNDFATLVGDWFGPTALTMDADLYASLGALTLAEGASFSAEIVDAEGIYYQSFAGVSQPRGEASAELDDAIAAACAGDGADITGALLPVRHDRMALPLAPFAPILGREEGRDVPNDGLVTVASAKWGHFRGCVAADHMEQLGQHDLPDVNVRTGFDVARFYADLAGDLAGEGPVMRAIFLASLLVAGCQTEAPAQNDCDQATRIFARCGVELPVLQTGTCNGVAKAVARCVVKVGTDCDALAMLSSRIDECVAQANDDLPPLKDPPISALDAGGLDDGGSADLAHAADLGSASDLASSSTDLASPRWAGLDVSGSIATGSTRSYQAALDPGTYTYTLTGTGDIDLYVRIGHLPTTTLYDCRPFLGDSNEACTITVTATDIVYVLLRSDVVASTFHLVAKED